MLNPPCCLEVARLLDRQGVPDDRIARITGELAEHWEDLRSEACANGLSPAAAEMEANERLGEPSRLVAGIMAGLRRSSWLGRHPILCLCLGSLLLPPLLMAVIVGPFAWLDNITQFSEWINGGRAVDPHVGAALLWSLHYVSVTAVFGWLWWRGWRAGLGIRWMLALAAWCALMSLVRWFDADPSKRMVALGLSFPLRLNIHSAILLVIHALPVGVLWLRLRRREQKWPDKAYTS